MLHQWYEDGLISRDFANAPGAMDPSRHGWRSPPATAAYSSTAPP